MLSERDYHADPKPSGMHLPDHQLITSCTDVIFQFEGSQISTYLTKSRQHWAYSKTSHPEINLGENILQSEVKEQIPNILVSLFKTSR